MAKRKSKVNPVSPATQRDLAELGPVVDAARDGPAYHEPATERADLVAALWDILKCNTARKCHDRARAALAELDP